MVTEGRRGKHEPCMQAMPLIPKACWVNMLPRQSGACSVAFPLGPPPRTSLNTTSRNSTQYIAFQILCAGVKGAESAAHLSGRCHLS